MYLDLEVTVYSEMFYLSAHQEVAVYIEYLRLFVCIIPVCLHVHYLLEK